MARMIPKRPPSTAPSSEARVFERLESALGEDFTILHAVRWLERPKGKGRPPAELECDFLVCHPEHGAMVLEVKGGEVGFDGATGDWFSRDRAGQVHRIKDPFGQARNACHSLLDLLRGSVEFPKAWGPFGYGVVFPDGIVTKGLVQTPSEIVIDAMAIADKRKLTAAVDELYRYWGSQPSQIRGKVAVSKIVELLGSDLTIRSPLVSSIDEADWAIIQLSEQQKAVLDYMRAARRVEVSGCAGSGKTLLAAAKARELAGQGFKVLLTCYNKALAEHLNEGLAGLEGLMVTNFHQLCARLAGKAGIGLNWPAGPDPEFFGKRLPNALLKVVERIGPQFDAIIVDEGQDFAAAWWDPLLYLLTDPDAGIFYVFYDDNQSLYGRPVGLPPGSTQFPLNQNWRNTHEINSKILEYYRGPDIHCMGPHGPAVQVIDVTGTLRSELSKVLFNLHRSEGVPAHDITVLTPSTPSTSGLVGDVGQFRVTEGPAKDADVRISSIHGYKGLDAKVVILAGVSDRIDRWRELMYVGCSRARSCLVVLTLPS